MIRADVITLVTESSHGVFESNTPTTTDVFAEILSVKMTEFYTALNEGIEPQYIFKLTDYADYNGQKIVIYNNVEYDVIRAYTPVNGQTVELTVKRREVNQ